jgi:hypothetical protein
MTSDRAALPHPNERLRQLALLQLDRLAEHYEDPNRELTLPEHERLARSLIAITKLAGQLFGPEENAPSRKIGEALKKEDDAIRAEFARRLATMLRGKQMAAAAEADEARPPDKATP